MTSPVWSRSSWTWPGCLRLSLFAVIFAVILLCPALAAAQSAISGQVRDDTGGVLPGVTVEAASPVLIEQTRTVITDGQGRYSIVDLRPGVYKVTFSLAGFSSVVREGIQLPANFTASVDVVLRIGGIEETLTVSGESPVVDVQAAGRTQVMSREILDSVPTARNFTGHAALVPGVRMSNTDVGGNQQMEQIYMRVHGASINDVTVEVDGMRSNTMNNSPGGLNVVPYFNDAMQAEITYQTSGITAEASAGGIRISMVPQEGGNTYSGTGFFGFADGSWQGDNLTQELRDRGLRSGNRISHISNLNLALGGPIFRDKLWFYGSYQRLSTDGIVANCFYPSGEAAYGTAPPWDLSRPCVEDEWLQNRSLRLTWQATPRNKFNVFFDHFPKFKGHEHGGALTDPATAASRRDPVLFYMSQVKWTSAVSSRLLLEGGLWLGAQNFSIASQPGLLKVRGTPDWFTHVSKRDVILGTTWGGNRGRELGWYPEQMQMVGSASYVTGSHAFKVGVQWTSGTILRIRDGNADLEQRYRAGVPDTVGVFNTPAISLTGVDADLGIYAQDSWRIDRVTINGGVRLEVFRGSIDEMEVPAGRFVGPRHIEGQPGLPDWFDVAPRFGVVYDVFGNAKTALKAGINKYMRNMTVQIPERYNPLVLQTDVRTWRDTNGDDVAQDGEIGRSNNLAFGLPSIGRRPDPDLRREYDLEYSVGIQQEVAPGVAATFAWYRRGYHRLETSRNLLIGLADYTPVSVVSPLDGEVFTIYNVAASKLGQRDIVDTNSADSDKRRRSYNGFELSASARLPFGGTVFGGWTTERTIDVMCNSLDDPNTFRFCDQSELDIPFRGQFKLGGVLPPLPAGVSASIAWQSYPGDPLGVNWIVGPRTQYAANCLGPCQPGALVVPGMTVSSMTLALIPPGAKYLGRLNQIDISVQKTFRFGSQRLSGQVDLFNALNSSYVKSENQTFGPSLGQPTSILQPRTLRLAAQFRF